MAARKLNLFRDILQPNTWRVQIYDHEKTATSCPLNLQLVKSLQKFRSNQKQLVHRCFHYQPQLVLAFAKSRYPSTNRKIRFEDQAN